MQGKKKASHWKRWVLVGFLAVLCIGGAELLVCRVMDPALYARITTPIWEGCATLLQDAQNFAGGLWEKVEAMEPKEEPEEQLAGEPSIEISSTEMADNSSLSKLEQRGEEEFLLGGNREIVYYNQGDEAWSGQPYGSDRIGGYGCGPAVMAMVVSSMTEQRVNPAEMAQWAREHGHWAKGRGSYLSVVEGTTVAYGLRAEPIGELSAAHLRRELASGKLVVALMTRGHFTGGGHFILLRGATLEGDVLVADPSSRERSLMVWDPQLIVDELSASRNNGAPLWSIQPNIKTEGDGG